MKHQPSRPRFVTASRRVDKTMRIWYGIRALIIDEYVQSRLGTWTRKERLTADVTMTKLECTHDHEQAVAQRHDRLGAVLSPALVDHLDTTVFGPRQRRRSQPHHHVRVPGGRLFYRHVSASVRLPVVAGDMGEYPCRGWRSITNCAITGEARLPSKPSSTTSCSAGGALGG